MSAADEGRRAVRDLTPAQLRAALMCWWVADPTSFWKAVLSARAGQRAAGSNAPGGSNG